MLVEEQVRGLDVAVEDAPAMRVVERPRDVAADVRGLGTVRGSPASSIERRLPPSSSSSTMNGSSPSSPQSWTVTMFAWCSDAAKLGLGLEATQEAGVRRERCVQHFHRDTAPQT